MVSEAKVFDQYEEINATLDPRQSCLSIASSSRELKETNFLKARDAAARSTKAAMDWNHLTAAHPVAKISHLSHK